MKVTGFSFIKNAIKFDYPIVASINSILPIVDEYVIMVGNSNDETKQLIQNLNNPKIKIFDSVWDESSRLGGKVLAQETDKAFAQVSADTDWAFYLQGDEVLHEKDYPAIRKAMLDNLPNKKVEGLLFKYFHFYGNYSYTGAGKQWYRQEVRIIRNDKNIISWKDAQGFRFKNETKLRVKKIDAHIYHYGWVKPPKIAFKKAQYFQYIMNPAFNQSTEEQDFDYHHIDWLKPFTGEHPAAIKEKIKQVNWHYEYDLKQSRFKKMKFKHKLAFIIEDLTGYRVGEYKNFKLI
jgi:hypothetical protein